MNEYCFLFTYYILGDESNFFYRTMYAFSREEAIKEFDKKHLRRKGKKIGRIVSVVQQERLEYSQYYTAWDTSFGNCFSSYYNTARVTNNYSFTYNTEDNITTLSSGSVEIANASTDAAYYSIEPTIDYAAILRDALINNYVCCEEIQNVLDEARSELETIASNAAQAAETVGGIYA